MNWIIQTNIITILIATWAIFSFQVGFREARYYYCKNEPHPSLKKDEHGLFTIHRIMVFIPHLIAFILIRHDLIHQSWWMLVIEGCLFTAACILVFPFFHDGSYYTERNNLDPDVYSKRWMDFNDSTAIFDFTFMQRTVMFIMGVGGYVVATIL